MHIERYRDSANDLVISFAGEFDAVGTADVRPTLEEIAAMTDEPHVVLDLSGVTFMDSSGIGAIVFLFKRLRADGRSLALVGVYGQTRQLIELLRVDKALPVSFLAETGMQTA